MVCSCNAFYTACYSLSLGVCAAVWDAVTKPWQVPLLVWLALVHQSLAVSNRVVHCATCSNTASHTTSPCLLSPAPSRCVIWHCASVKTQTRQAW